MLQQGKEQTLVRSCSKPGAYLAKAGQDFAPVVQMGKQRR